MSTFTIDATGQVTLSKDILEHLGVYPDGKITVSKFPDGRIELKAARLTGTISDVFGLLKRNDGTSLSIDELSEIAVRGWAGK
jgi:hypothetical protein